MPGYCEAASDEVEEREEVRRAYPARGAVRRRCAVRLWWRGPYGKGGPCGCVAGRGAVARRAASAAREDRRAATPAYGMSSTHSAHIPVCEWIHANYTQS